MRPTDDQIEEQLNLANEAMDAGESVAPRAGFEQGVITALEWVLELSPTAPMED